MGGFDTSFPLAAAEDREFCDRLRRQGRRLLYVRDAVVAHAHPLTFGGFLRQHFNYGRGAFQFHCIRARRDQAPIQVEPVSFYVDLLRLPLTLKRRTVRLMGLVFLSQVANAVGFYFGKLTSRPRCHNEHERDRSD